MGALLLDLRYSLRMMAKTPGLTAILATTLALGIGASTTIFSVVSSVVLEDLPYEQPDRIVRLYTEFHGGDQVQRNFPFSVVEMGEIQEACRSCDLVAGYFPGSAPLSGGDRPVRISVGYGTHQLLPLLGVAPLMGRWFDASEDSAQKWMPGAQIVGDPSVVVINYEIWKGLFGGDPQIIGRRVELDAIPVTIVGVMPKGFKFADMEAWVPARLDFNMPERSGHNGGVVARLAPGATVESLNQELTALVTQWGTRDAPTFHTISPRHPIVAVGYQRDLIGSISTMLWMLQAAVLFVLLISIVNVANLLLAKSESRNREIAVRHALGASRRRLLRQFVTESLLLGVLGAGLGLLVTVWALDGVTALIPSSAPRATEISLDGTAVLFAIGCAMFASLLFGLAPIVHAKKTDLHGALKDGSGRMTGSRARLRARRVLVIIEIALAMVLVIGCTVMVRTFMRLQRVEVGFKPDNLLTFGINLPLRTYEHPTASNLFWDRLEANLRAMPGVESAALVAGFSVDRGRNIETIRIVGQPEPSAADEMKWTVDYVNIVGANALTTLGTRFIKGRDFSDSDSGTSPRVIIVNQAFVAKFFPNEDPLGHEVVTYADPDVSKRKAARIVGVIADMKNAGLDKPAGSELFMPRAQFVTLRDPPFATLVQHAIIRSGDAPEQLVPAASRVVAELDPSIPLYEVRTMNDLMWEAVARPRFLAFLLTAFAALALLLAAVGIYGVMAHTVAQRTHEIGLRVALGAQPSHVRAMVLRQAASLVLLGVALGLGVVILLQIALGDALKSLFFGEQLSQPILLVAVALVVAATALLATWLPARRATKVEPTVALRSE